MNTKQATKNVKSALLAPQCAPFCIDNAAKSAKRRKKFLTQADIGKAEAMACGAGRWNY